MGAISELDSGSMSIKHTTTINYSTEICSYRSPVSLLTSEDLRGNESGEMLRSDQWSAYGGRIHCGWRKSIVSNVS